MPSLTESPAGLAHATHAEEIGTRHLRELHDTGDKLSFAQVMGAFLRQVL